MGVLYCIDICVYPPPPPHTHRVYKDARGPHEVTGVAGGKTVQVEKDNFKDTGEVYTKELFRPSY